MKRVLVISYYWPPTGGSGVQRWVKFAKYLPSCGWQPVIYTPANPEQLAVDESLCADIPEGTEVIRTRIIEPYGIYRALTGGRKAKGAGVNPLNAQHKSLAQRLAIALRGLLFIPDPRVWWVRPSVRHLRRYLREHPVDVMVTTGPPQSMHLIALGIRRSLGDKAPAWVADFRDPWTEMFYFKHMGLTPWAQRRHRRLEQQVLDGADAIVAVTPYVQRDFQARTQTPVHLVTNGFDPDDFASRGKVSGDRFAVVHTGLFASDGNPLALWDVLADRCRSVAGFAQALQIRLAGKVDPEIIEAVRSRGLGDNLVDLGYLQHGATSVEQQSADLLILPLRQEPEYAKVLPGKIFEYLAARRPVLGIGQEDGAAAEVLRSTGAGVMCDWNAYDTIASAVDRAWQQHLDGSGDSGTADISAYSRVSLSARMAQILEDISNKYIRQ